MKISLILYTVGVVFLFSIRDGEVSAQNFLPGYFGGGPILYSGGKNDDDMGLLLAILVLASKRGCGFGGGGGNCGNSGGCGNCGCCNNSRTVPIPYPIPFPTNNPVITNSRNGNCNNDETSKGNNGPIFNVTTEVLEESSSVSNTNNSPSASSGSTSGSSSGSSANNSGSSSGSTSGSGSSGGGNNSSSKTGSSGRGRRRIR